jgi:endonuclease YncB( thermonuclease family)
MAKAIQQLKFLTIGRFGLGERGQGIGSPAQQIHDGDTLTVRALGNFGVRFLGVDAPEESFDLPGTPAVDFIGIEKPPWEDFLSQPFDETRYGPITLSAGLKRYLRSVTGPGTAANHAHHADVATAGLKRMVADDLTRLGQTSADFAFFLAFAYEIMDGYGRLLAYINCDQPAAPRPAYYNERMLEAGLVVPYFIFPNIDPFVNDKSPLRSVGENPAAFRQKLRQSPKLTAARAWVGAARTAQIGVFEAANPLRLLPFELRFLAQRRAPNRWVIDLGKDDNVLLKPENYYRIPNLEDRLFIPEEFVPLFVSKGWKKQR